MWPAKAGLGAQLTYGVYGNAVVDRDPSSPDLSPHLCFPRSKDGADRLHLVQNSARQLRGKEHSNKAFRSAKKLLLVEEKLIDALDAEAYPFQRDMGLDPSMSTLSVDFDLGVAEYRSLSKPSFLAVRCVACVVADSIMVFPLLPKKKNVLRLSNAKELKKTLCAVPSEKRMASFKFPFQVCQVEYSVVPKLLVVRGEQEIWFLSVSWIEASNTKGVKIEDGIQIEKAFSLKVPGPAILHIHTNGDRLIVFDVDDRYTLYSLVDSPWRYERGASKHHSTRSPFDKSRFVRAHLPAESDSMLVFHRKTLLKVSFEHDKVEKYVSFHNWSHLLDYKLSGQEIFILTSQEIIWLRMGGENGIQRLLSWKHYLDTSDYSFKMAFHHREKDDVMMCMVYSLNSPIIIHFSFAMRGNRPCSVRDPYYTRTKLKAIKHICVCLSAFDKDDYLTNVFLVGDGEVNYLAMSHLSDLAFKPADNPSETIIMREDRPRLLPLLFNGKEKQFVLQNFTHTRSSSNESEADSTDYVQDFALKLGTDIESTFSALHKVLQGFKSLATIAKNVPIDVLDLSEFDSMLQQLAEFYDSRGIKLNTDEYTTANQLLPLVKKSTNSLTEALLEALESYNDPHIVKTAIMLVTSLVKAKNSNFFKNIHSEIESEAAKHDKKHQNMFDEWTLEDTIEPKAPPETSTNLLKKAVIQNSQIKSQMDSQFQTGNDEVQVPSLQSPENFGSQTSHASQEYVLPSSQPRAHSQSKSQPQLQLKRVGSQNPSQKRKKKKGGFA